MDLKKFGVAWIVMLACIGFGNCAKKYDDRFTLQHPLTNSKLNLLYSINFY